jgi:4-amino-4-deoxy-L-arabinose transferase-like glycosyltransferase
MAEMQKGKDWRNWMLLLPIVISAILYLSTASGRAVIDYDEGYYSQAALQMVERGDWITPYVNGVRFLEKPPLMYWLTASSFKIFGINEFALRLPTSLAVIALVWIVMLIARRASGNQAAAIAGLCTSCSAGTYLFTREALHDIWLVFFIALSMYAFFEWTMDPQRRPRFALLFYASLAGAVMCKSLVGVALPIGIVIVFFLLVRQRPKWSDLHVIPGSLLFLVLAAPWHWMATLRNPDFLYSFFVNEQFLRFIGKHDPPVLWSLPLLAFWALVLVWVFPWTAFLPAAFAAAHKPEGNGERALAKLAFAWIIVIMGFFSISARLEHYAFPVLPALSLLSGLTLSKNASGRVMKWAFRALAALGLLILAAGAGVTIWLATSGSRLASALSGSSSRISATDFSILSEMPAGMIGNLIKPAVITIVALAAGFLTALWFDTRRRRLHAVFSITAAALVLCGMTHWSLIICEDLISSKKFGVAIAKEFHPGDRLIVVGDYESANSISFYQPLHVEVFDGQAYALIPGMKYRDAPRILLSKQDFEEAWQSPNRVFTLLPKSRLTDLKPGGVEMLEVLDRVLVRNH